MRHDSWVASYDLSRFTFASKECHRLIHHLISFLRDGCIAIHHDCTACLRSANWRLGVRDEHPYGELDIYTLPRLLATKVLLGIRYRSLISRPLGG